MFMWIPILQSMKPRGGKMIWVDTTSFVAMISYTHICQTFGKITWLNILGVTHINNPINNSRNGNDPDMHHGTCVTHVPWCMPGSLIFSKLLNHVAVRGQEAISTKSKHSNTDNFSSCWKHRKHHSKKLNLGWVVLGWCVSQYKNT